MDIDRIVSVTITKATSVPSLPAYNIILVAAEFLKTAATPNYGASERVRIFSSLADVGTCFGTSSPIYAAASAIFSQSPSVDQLYIGRKLTGGDGTETWSAALTAMNVDNPNWYALVAETRLLADQEAIAAWVEANTKLYLTASADPVMIGSGSTDIASYLKTNNYSRSMALYDAASVFRNKGLMTFNIDFVSLNSIVFTVNGVALSPVTYNTSNVQTYADIKTALEAAFAGATVAVDAVARTVSITKVGSSFTWSVAVTLGASQAVGTPTYPNDSTEKWMEAAWFGIMMPKTPGAANWAFKTLSGQAVYYLTGAEIGYVIGKYGNIYTAIAGVSCTQFGRTGSGDYADVIQGLDWLKTQIQGNIFTLLINSDKVGFDDAGIQQIVGQLRAALQAGVDAGIIGKDYIVSYPAAADVSSANKAARNLPDVKFTATLVGAVNTVVINGTVVL